MAKLWDLPCVFACKNKYGMGTSAERSLSNTKNFTRGDKISGIQANGMDVIASAHAVKYACEWVIWGKGSLFLEFVTLPLCMVTTRVYFLPYDDTGAKHNDRMSDPGTTYHTREEVQCMHLT